MNEPIPDPLIKKLDTDIQKTNVYKEMTCDVQALRESQNDIVTAIDDEKKLSQESFAKGNVRFTRIESEIGELREEVGEMKTQIQEGFKQQRQDFTQHIIDSERNEVKKLNGRLDARDQVKNGIIITLVGSLAVYAVIRIIEIFAPIAV